MIELVTIERVGRHFKCILWGAGLEKLATASGKTPQGALYHALAVLARGAGT